MITGTLLRTTGTFSLFEQGGRFVVVGGPEDQVLCNQPDRKTAEAVYEDFITRAARARAETHRRPHVLGIERK